MGKTAVSGGAHAVDTPERIDLLSHTEGTPWESRILHGSAHAHIGSELLSVIKKKKVLKPVSFARLFCRQIVVRLT